MKALLSGLLICFAAGLLPEKAASQSEAVPANATVGILEAFRAHRLVAIGHHDDESQAFLRTLIGDDRLSATVNDIVVEFGSARYQELMDRYQRGERVPARELEQVWQNVTGPNGSFDVPAIEQFFRAVRDKNWLLPEQRRMRVLLGEPPIDWTQIRNEADYIAQLQTVGNRDAYVAELIRREVLDKARRALIVYGSLHFQRKTVWANYGSEWPEADTLVMQLEAQAPREVFTIWRVTTSMQVPTHFTTWRVPSLALLKNTDLGAADFGRYFPYDGERRAVRNGKAVVIPREQWQSLRMEDQFDAVIYLGPEASFEDWA
ncbi:MAG: hypothetical protein ACREXP_22515, partial [Steroidobacteraceae bacterium]